MSKCRAYRDETVECTDDFQCPVTHYCWYKSKAEKQAGKRRCMEMYSRHEGATFGWEGSEDLEGYTQNGKFCLSGLAY